MLKEGYCDDLAHLLIWPVELFLQPLHQTRQLLRCATPQCRLRPPFHVGHEQVRQHFAFLILKVFREHGEQEATVTNEHPHEGDCLGTHGVVPSALTRSSSRL